MNHIHSNSKMHPALNPPLWVNALITTLSLAFLGLFIIAPLGVILTEAFRAGVGVWLASIREPDALAAIRLTLLVAAIAVPLNMVFGVAASWAIAKFRFRGRTVLLTLIDLPFADHNLQIIFAIPGIVLSTLFVTFPFVARELIPLMTEQGSEEEQAALSLGANGWQIFRRVTLPNIKWGLLYGVILCNARSMGEFGAVSVVSGHIRGETNTLPLHIEVLYNEYNFAAAFACASLLAALALVTLAVKSLVEWRSGQT